MGMSLSSQLINLYKYYVYVKIDVYIIGIVKVGEDVIQDEYQFRCGKPAAGHSDSRVDNDGKGCR